MNNDSAPAESKDETVTLDSREIDARLAIAQGWKMTKIGPDARGENECEILTQLGKIPDGYDLPKLGKIHRAFLVPQWSTDLSAAIRLAKSLGIISIDITCPINHLPTRIAMRCLKVLGGA